MHSIKEIQFKCNKQFIVNFDEKYRPTQNFVPDGRKVHKYML